MDNYGRKIVIKHSRTHKVGLYMQMVVRLFETLVLKNVNPEPYRKCGKCNSAVAFEIFLHENIVLLHSLFGDKEVIFGNTRHSHRTALTKSAAQMIGIGLIKRRKVTLNYQKDPQSWTS